ncbi:MAG: hypothetical protein Kow00127_24060 [Bacteroidales bacterium]
MASPCPEECPANVNLIFNIQMATYNLEWVLNGFCCVIRVLPGIFAMLQNPDISSNYAML